MRFHLIFLLWLFGPPHRNDLPPEIITPLLLKTWPSAVALVVSHGVSFVVNFLGTREYERTTVAAEQGAPWNRVVMMHMTIIFGGWVVMLAHQPVGGLVVLGLLKIVADLHGHLRQRRGPAPAPTPAGFPARAGAARARETAADSSLAGKPIAGDWKLLVSDHESVDVGKLNRWSLTIRRALSPQLPRRERTARG